MRKFESLSGAILSRNKKCQILGFGSWEDREIWPLNYLKTVKEIKVFGVFIMNSYNDLQKRNWNYRFEKFEQSVLSWSPRVLETIFQRVEVVRTFALSRIFYLASILPLPATIARKIEKVIGKFLWSASGKILRIALEELKNPAEKGGCGLVCIKSMAQSLLLSQFLRLLKSEDSKSVSHVGYWIGELLGDFLPGIELGEHAGENADYFDYLATVVVDARIAEQVTVENWKKVTNKMIYQGYSAEFPVPKVETESGVSYKQVLRRLCNPCLTSSAREVLFLLVHNKLPVRERFVRIKVAVDPYCEHCLDITGAEICDVEHFFLLLQQGGRNVEEA